jgi:hypothetical protein
MELPWKSIKWARPLAATKPSEKTPEASTFTEDARTCT